MATVLPPYTARLTDTSPPAYAFPKTYKIGSTSSIWPLVKAAELKGHLALLGAFAALRTRVEGLDAKAEHLRLPQMPIEKDRRWTWFVGLAVERFEIWCKSLQGIDWQVSLDVFIPPLDVIMVWHAYMLNPRRYAEDSVRIPWVRILERAGEERFISMFRTRPDKLSAVSASPGRIARWVEKTFIPFDPLEAAAQLTHRNLLCPACQTPITTLFMNNTGTGYLQQNFTTTCPLPACRHRVTKETLAVRKLASDLTLGDGTLHSFLAGTVQTPTDTSDLTRARRIKTAIMFSKRLQRPMDAQKRLYVSDDVWQQKIMEEAKYSLAELRSMMVIGMKHKGGTLIGRIMSGYTDDRLFSIDLVGATLRQGTFVRKMRDLGWTESGFFKSREDEVALQHAIARYHAFLDLMASSPASFFVPTLDIDLVWHTHQLKGAQYGADCTKHVGRFINHDDKVEETRLSSAFDITCRAWKARFGVNYTHCGCPLPGDTIGRKLSRLVGSMASPASLSHLHPPNRDDLLGATHPSDHNAVYAIQHKGASEAARKRRLEKIARRRKRDEETAKKEGRSSGSGDGGYGHSPAFLVPVPVYFYDPMYDSRMTGCAAETGHVVDTQPGAGCVIDTVSGFVDFFDLAGCGNDGGGGGDGGGGDGGGGGGDGGGGGGGDGGGGGCGGGD